MDPSRLELEGAHDIAIIGMSCLFPGAEGLDAFWQNIVSKVDATTDPPPEAWDEAVFYDPASTATDRVYCKRGGYLGPIARFNPLAHGVVPLAVEGGEPDQWLALQLAHDALTDAGYADRSDARERQRTAVIIGKGTYINRGNLSLVQHGLMVEQVIQILRSLHPEYAESDFEAVRQELKRSLPPLTTDTASALIPNIIAGRIANRLDLMGPSYTVDGACASSLLAVEIATRELITGQCDLALVGGSQVTTPIPILTLFCQLNALSHQQTLRAFDAAADGTILGEGIGMVVLKRRADAERDGDRIYAVIKGVGTASDGRAVSVMAPRLEGEVLALRRAYESAGVAPQTVELVEAHGTGTPVGDVVELRALAEVFGLRQGAFPRCGLGTVKSMIGHTMPAAGIAGLIKAALALYHKTLPPTLHCETPNPKLELDTTPFYINTETRPWIHGSRDMPRRAGVNAFGFGGINAHVVLEEHPAQEASATRSHHLHWDSEVCILGAESRDGLIQQAERVLAFLEADPRCDLKDLAYSLNVADRAAGESWRLAVVATSLVDLQQKLMRARHRIADPACDQLTDVRGIYFTAQPLGSGKLAFLFPGEGAQYVNMLSDLCIHFPAVRACFDQIDRAYIDHPRGYVPSDCLFPPPAFSPAERAEAAQRLWQMDVAIEAVLTANHALFTLLSHLAVRPDAILGHSTGEYMALRASGMLALDDEAAYLRLLQTMNRSYEHEVTQSGVPRAALLAIGADRARVEALITQVAGELHIAMDNCPHQTVVAGYEDAIGQVAEMARAAGLICERLSFDRGYHTPLFETYANGLRQIFADLPFAAPAIETYSCTTGRPYPSEPAAMRTLALEHWVRPVEFSKTIISMYEEGIRVFVEVGPKGNLTSFVQDILRERPHLAVPANVARRSGIDGMNHMLGKLAAHGVPMRLDYLYERRAPRRLTLDAPAQRCQPAPRLATGWPSLSLSLELTERLRSREGRAQESDSTVAPAPVASSLSSVDIAPDVMEDSASRADSGDATAVALNASEPVRRPDEHSPGGWEVPAVPAEVSTVGSVDPFPLQETYPSHEVGENPARTLAVHAYLHTMDVFLATQRQVMQDYLRRARGGHADGIVVNPAFQGDWQMRTQYDAVSSLE